jgi:hypothetical protein
MLQSEKPIVSQAGRVRMPENTEKPALMLWVSVGFARLDDVGAVWRDHTK